MKNAILSLLFLLPLFLLGQAADLRSDHPTELLASGSWPEVYTPSSEVIELPVKFNLIGYEGESRFYQLQVTGDLPPWAIYANSGKTYIYNISEEALDFVEYDQGSARIGNFESHVYLHLIGGGSGFDVSDKLASGSHLGPNYGLHVEINTIQSFFQAGVGYTSFYDPDFKVKNRFAYLEAGFGFPAIKDRLDISFNGVSHIDIDNKISHFGLSIRPFLRLFNIKRLSVEATGGLIISQKFFAYSGQIGLRHPI